MRVCWIAHLHRVRTYNLLSCAFWQLCLACVLPSVRSARAFYLACVLLPSVRVRVRKFAKAKFAATGQSHVTQAVTFIPRQHSAQSSLICAHRLRHHAMKLDLQRSKLPTAGLLTRRVTEGLVSVSLAVLLAGGPTPAALASTPTTLLAGGGRFLDGEAGLLWDEGTKTRMMEKATAAKEKVTHAHS